MEVQARRETKKLPPLSKVPVTWQGRFWKLFSSSSAGSPRGFALLPTHLPPEQGTAERKSIKELDKSKQHKDSEQIGFCTEYFKMYILP